MVWGRMPGSSANWGRMNGFECEQRTTTVGWLQEEDTSRHGTREEDPTCRRPCPNCVFPKALLPITSFIVPNSHETLSRACYPTCVGTLPVVSLIRQAVIIPVYPEE